ncbi:hypothetical protein ACNFBR_10580 [Pseudomonas sp. NY11955]|uniref:hypothetical protein n=1 Tax=Pseudomonas sp. NY11955 TaxID=3400363 RepID=UPI003A8A1249
MTGAESLQLFQQLVANANSLFLSDADFVVINGISKPTLKKIYAEFLASMGTYTTVAAGLAATSGTGTNNRFFSVPGTGDVFETRYRNDAGVAVEVSSLLSWLSDSQTINRGKGFPLKQMNRGGVTSTASATLNRLILEVKVVGDSQYLDGKLYRIAYFQNEANLSGNIAHGIVLEEFDAGTYSSSGVAVTIHSANNAPAPIVRTGGVQTFTIVPALRPNIQFVITIDAAALPAAGTAVSALNSGSAGYSWIIEQSCYIGLKGIGNSISLNRNRVYPQKSSARNGVTSVQPLLFMACLLDFQVVGARPGKLYRVAYFNNGYPLPNSKQDGWIIEEFDALGYETSNNPANIVVNYSDPTPDIPRAGIQTVVVESPSIAGMHFRITVDTTAFPAFGTRIPGNISGQAGYSYIIDPQRYTLAAPAAQSTSIPLEWSMDSSNNLRVAWVSKGRCFRLRFGPNGVNQLPNLISVEGAPGSDLSTAAWVVLSTTNSDWFPPMRVSADANGDGGAINFTGGAHGSNGDATGNPTARNILFKCFADGVPIAQGQSGRSERVRFQIINELMGYNTSSLGRYILRQSLSVNVTPSCMEVDADVTALENISVRTDYGLQLLSGGFRGTQLVLGGSNTARGSYQLADNNSGAKSSFPNAWAIVLQDDTNGQMAMWMDKSYASGNSEHVADTEPLLRGSVNGKWYLGAVLSPTGKAFPAKGGYKYRAGVSWQGPAMQPASLDSVIEMTKASHPTFAYGLPNADFVKVS